MLDKEKVWLVYYIDVGSLHREDVPVYMNEVSKHLRADESIQQLFIPIKEEETRVELLYAPDGKYSDELLQKTMEELNKVKEMLDNESGNSGK